MLLRDFDNDNGTDGAPDTPTPPQPPLSPSPVPSPSPQSPPSPPLPPSPALSERSTEGSTDYTCLVCQCTLIGGQAAAIEHATATGHTNIQLIQ